jgi:hypothetical protein
MRTENKIHRLLTLREKLGDYLETFEQGFDLRTDTAEIFYDHDGHVYLISIQELEDDEPDAELVAQLNAD